METILKQPEINEVERKKLNSQEIFKYAETQRSRRKAEVGERGTGIHFLVFVIAIK